MAVPAPVYMRRGSGNGTRIADEKIEAGQIRGFSNTHSQILPMAYILLTTFKGYIKSGGFRKKLCIFTGLTHAFIDLIEK